MASQLWTVTLTYSVQARMARTPPTYMRASYAVVATHKRAAYDKAVAALLKRMRYEYDGDNIDVMTASFEECGDLSFQRESTITKFAAQRDMELHWRAPA